MDGSRSWERIKPINGSLVKFNGIYKEKKYADLQKRTRLLEVGGKDTDPSQVQLQWIKEH